MARNLIGNVYPSDDYLHQRCAPAGFGFGAAECVFPPDADADRIDKVGFFQCTKGTPNENENWYVIPLIHMKGVYEHQIAIRVVDGCRAERTMVNGNWGAWGWVNPPLSHSVEYRTTERYMDKPVYTMVYSFGKMPNATTKSVAHGIPVVTPVCCSGQYGNTQTIPGITSAGETKVSFDKTNVYINSTTDLSAHNAYVQLWYTKT